jgi:transcriptional regulator GlxA family with amidase domain
LQPDDRTLDICVQKQMAEMPNVLQYLPMSDDLTASRKVALVGYPGVQSLDLVGPLEVFAMANRFGGRAFYDVLLASPEGGAITCNSGVTLAGSIALADLPAALDTILIGGGDEAGLLSMRNASVFDWLNRRIANTRRIGSVCSGAFVLAAAGVLDGRRATTHWEVCDQLQSFRPSVRVEPDAIFVADPPYYTSAGVTAGIDLCLSFVEADCGAQVALAVARNLVLFMRRPGGQTQYSAGLKVQAAATPRLRQLIADISADPSGELTVPHLAERAMMSERTFARAFHRETGVSPAAFVELARVNRAKAFLETSEWPLTRVADRAGFGSVEALHRAFNKRVLVTPGEYRQRFGRPGASAKRILTD